MGTEGEELRVPARDRRGGEGQGDWPHFFSHRHESDIMLGEAMGEEGRQ